MRGIKDRLKGHEERLEKLRSMKGVDTRPEQALVLARVEELQWLKGDLARIKGRVLDAGPSIEGSRLTRVEEIAWQIGVRAAFAAIQEA